MSSQTDSTLLSLAVLCVKSASTYDFSAFTPLVDSETFRHRLFPSSLGHPTDGLTAENFVAHLTKLQHLLPNLGIDVENPVRVLVAEQERVVVFQLKGDGKTASGEDYKGEYNITVRFNEAKKITSVDEWVDSAYVKEVMGRERKSLEAKA